LPHRSNKASWVISAIAAQFTGLPLRVRMNTVIPA